MSNIEALGLPIGARRRAQRKTCHFRRISQVSTHSRSLYLLTACKVQRPSEPVTSIQPSPLGSNQFGVFTKVIRKILESKLPLSHLQPISVNLSSNSLWLQQHQASSDPILTPWSTVFQQTDFYTCFRDDAAFILVKTHILLPRIECDELSCNTVVIFDHL